MDITFIYKSLKITFFLTLLCAAFFLYYFGTTFTMGMLSGSFWNIVNFLLFIGLSKAIMDASRNKAKIALLALLKFGVLYAIGYLIVRVAKFSIYAILLGFSLLFAVILLRALGRALLFSKA